MQIIVISPNGDLKREVWIFYLSVNTFSSLLWLDKYTFETRDTKRHGWVWQTRWLRNDRRDCNIGKPTIPENIIIEAKNKLKDIIDNLEVK